MVSLCCCATPLPIGWPDDPQIPKYPGWPGPPPGPDWLAKITIKFPDAIFVPNPGNPPGQWNYGDYELTYAPDVTFWAPLNQMATAAKSPGRWEVLAVSDLLPYALVVAGHRFELSAYKYNSTGPFDGSFGTANSYVIFGGGISMTFYSGNAPVRFVFRPIDFRPAVNGTRPASADGQFSTHIWFYGHWLSI